MLKSPFWLVRSPFTSVWMSRQRESLRGDIEEDKKTCQEKNLLSIWVFIILHPCLARLPILTWKKTEKDTAVFFLPHGKIQPALKSPRNAALREATVATELRPRTWEAVLDPHAETWARKNLGICRGQVYTGSLLQTPRSYGKIMGKSENGQWMFMDVHGC